MISCMETNIVDNQTAEACARSNDEVGDDGELCTQGTAMICGLHGPISQRHVGPDSGCSDLDSVDHAAVVGSDEVDELHGDVKRREAECTTGPEDGAGLLSEESADPKASSRVGVANTESFDMTGGGDEGCVWKDELIDTSPNLPR